MGLSLLNANRDKLLKDLNTFGLFFESMVIRDLRIYAQVNEASVYHYRDEKDLEADAIVESDSGDNWAAFEIKLGSGQDTLDKAAESLIKLSQRVDTKKVGEPTALVIIVGISEYAYTRKDGIKVIPINALADR